MIARYHPAVPNDFLLRFGWVVSIIIRVAGLIAVAALLPASQPLGLAAIGIGGIATVIVTFALGRVLCLCLLRVPILRISLCTPPVWLGFRLGKTRVEAGPSLLRIRVSYHIAVAAGRNIPILLSGPLGNLLAAGII